MHVPQHGQLPLHLHTDVFNMDVSASLSSYLSSS